MLGSQDVQVSAALPKASIRQGSDRRWIHVLLVVTDITAVGLGFLIAYYFRFVSKLPFLYEQTDSVFSRYFQMSLVLIPVWLLLLAAYQLYNSELLFGGMHEYSRVFNACTTGIMLVIAASFLAPNLVIARGWLLFSWFSVTALVGIGRFTLRRFVYHMRSRGYFSTRMLIIGADNEGIAVAEQLMSNSTAGVAVMGFVDDSLPKGTEVLPGLRVLGSSRTLRTLVHELGVRELTISSSAVSREKLLELFHTFAKSNDVGVRLSSGLFEILTTGLRVKSLGHVPLLSVDRVRLTGADVVLKTIVDYVGAAVLLLLLSPFFLVVGIAIKRSSPGPVFHRRRVLGVAGKEFDAFKFRTMVVNADEVLAQNPELKAEYAQNFKLRNDPRVTPIGAFLRKTSFDELPQLVNVLRGQMSLVGPRMIVKEELTRYGKWGMNLLTVKPGMTGLWQVSGRSDVDYDGRVRLDMYYIRNYTIWLDLQILFQTIPAVLHRNGAY
jgi:exopolysaccharide biosynthesis polyprenyl glycosylphosphotransferase